MSQRKFFSRYRGQSLENRLRAWFLLIAELIFGAFFVLMISISYSPWVSHPGHLGLLTLSRSLFLACLGISVLLIRGGRPMGAAMLFTWALMAQLGFALFLNDASSFYPYIGFTAGVVCVLFVNSFIGRKNHSIIATAAAAEAVLLAYAGGLLWGYRGDWGSSSLNALLISFCMIAMTAALASLARNLFRRVTEDLTGMRDSLENLAYTDPVTGLPNYNGLERKLQRTIAGAGAQPRGMALVGVDIDRFSRINQSHGFDAGNRALQEISARLRNCLGPSLPIFRTAGATFAFIVHAEEAGTEGVAAFAEEALTAAFQAPVNLGMDAIQLEFTAAMSCYPEDSQDAGEMIRSVLNTLTDRAKTKVGKITHFDEERYALAKRQTRIEELVQDAISRGEIRAVFQPKMDLADGTVKGVEILARWNSPELGAVPPSEFIPILERTKAILPFTRFMIEAAADAIRRVSREASASIRVAVNISPCLIHRAELIGLVDRLSRHFDLGGIDAELTEGVFIGYDVSALEQIRQLKERGLKLSIDDFGTGYSNIEYLQKLDADEMKIDRRFVMDTNKDERSSAELLTAIISMARALEMSTVAEGVENPRQAEILRNLGCDEIQGFWFAKPMPLDDLIPFVARRAVSVR